MSVGGSLPYTYTVHVHVYDHNMQTSLSFYVEQGVGAVKDYINGQDHVTKMPKKNL